MRLCILRFEETKTVTWTWLAGPGELQENLNNQTVNRSLLCFYSAVPARWHRRRRPDEEAEDRIASDSCFQVICAACASECRAVRVRGHLELKSVHSKHGHAHVGMRRPEMLKMSLMHSQIFE